MPALAPVERPSEGAGLFGEPDVVIALLCVEDPGLGELADDKEAKSPCRKLICRVGANQFQLVAKLLGKVCPTVHEVGAKTDPRSREL